MEKTIQPAGRLRAALSMPADKSISHRAAMFAALHAGSSEIRNFSEAADPQSTLNCLKKLGVPVVHKANIVRIQGVGRDGFQDPDHPLDCGNSGTTMRLLSGIVGGAGVSCTLVGDESLSKRTMKRIIDPLRAMNIEIKARRDDLAPLKISRCQPVKSLDFELPIPSAQLKSCVLLAGLFGEQTTRVIEHIPSRDHTERLLNLPIEKNDDKTVISSNSSIPIPPQSYSVAGDFSAAAFWLAAGSIHSDAEINMEGVGVNPSRTGAMHILQQMGAQITFKNRRLEGYEPVADLTVSSGNLTAVDIGKEEVPNCIDEIPILAVCMLFADGTSCITGAEELRHKETDRLSALADMFKRAGADFEEFEDGMQIYGRPDFIPAPAVYKSYDDHRIAMSAAVLALKGEKHSKVLNAGCTSISYPNFWNDMELLTN